MSKKESEIYDLVIETRKTGYKPSIEIVENYYQLITGKPFEIRHNGLGPDTDKWQGLNENEKMFLELEKKYSKQVSERIFNIKSIALRLKSLKDEVLKVERQKENSIGDNYYQLNLHHGELLKQISQTEQELDLAMMSESDRQAFDDFIEYKNSGKISNPGFTGQKI